MRRLITGGGLFIIASILVMLAFLVFETLPLWQGAKIEPTSLSIDGRSAGRLALLDVNEYRELVLGLGTNGVAHAWTSDGRDLLGTQVEELAGREVVAVKRSLDDTWLVATDSRELVPIRFRTGEYFEGSERRYRPEVSVQQPVRIDSVGRILTVAVQSSEDRLEAATLMSGGRLHVLRRSVETNLFGDQTFEDHLFDVELPSGVRVSAIEIYGNGRQLYMGTQDGRILEWSLGKDGAELIGTYPTGSSAVTSLGLLLGGSSLIVGTAEGGVDIWFRAPSEEGDLRLIRAHEFRDHSAPVEGSTPSRRNRTFLTWDKEGEIRVQYGTTAQTRGRVETGGPIQTAVIAPKTDGIFAALADGSIRAWTLDDPHPEVTLRTLFGKVHYERFAKPEFKWQSTGGTDESETKISLVPLIFGSLKGTFYAMLFSAPLAILAALYTSVFMRPRLRGVVKPTMELMATIPSVVLGLLAGLWLAPRLQNGMPILLLTGIFLPAIVLLLGASQVYLPAGLRRRIRPGTEAIILIPILALGLGLMVRMNGWADGLFDGGFLHWLFSSFEIRYDQRNALVVGIAMGLAVIPIIFSVSEDALSSVPRHLTAGSLALGATPWQTAWRVILPAASPGIFSALMIGFGRAVGETMIILMATGNTPILDWSLFNGFRTLSANIAVEIPEAPHGGSLYRVLFVSALLLFSLTLIVNTTAEIISTRLRRRYSRF